MSPRTGRNGSQADTLLSEVPLTLSEATKLAHSLHGSLQLGAILRGCRRFLALHFRMGRLSLVQHRANESTATLYSLDPGGDSPLIGPRVIALENSRLRECIADPGWRMVPLAAAGDQDRIEKRYLLSAECSFAVYAPLLLGRKLKGILVLDLPRKSQLAHSERALLSYVADNLALAIDNSDRHYLECRRSRQLEMVSEIARRAVQVEDLDVFLQDAAHLIRSSFDYHAVQVWTLAGMPEGLTVRAAACRMPHDSEGPAPVPWMVGECRRLNYTLCNNAVAPAGSTAGESTASQLAIPIHIRGKMLGVLYLESNRLDAFPVEDLSTMEGVASLIAGTYDNLRAYEHAQQSSEYMQAILESAKDLAILSTDTQGIVITNSVGSEPIFHLSSRQILGASVLTLFHDAGFRRDLATYIQGSDTSIFERKRLRQSRNANHSFLDVIVQRVHDPEKHPIGFLCITQDVTENIELEARLESLSVTDELTGLYNRRRFFAAVSGELERSRRFRRRLSLCFFDLDGFKRYNDLNGHRVGDRALRETAELVLACVRSGVDSCYRYGGDEFIIIMPETTRNNARLVAERIRELLKAHFHGEITASIGIAESNASRDVERLIEKADKAMYRAKSRGGDRTVLSD